MQMESISKKTTLLLGLIALSGCAGIDLGSDGLVYYDPEPYVLITTNKDCTQTITPVTLPGAKRSLKFKSGLGSAKLNVTLTNGMITTIGQETDTQIPQTITALTGLATAQIQGICSEETVLLKRNGIGDRFDLPRPTPAPPAAPRI